jgi:ankyrin repeat protein
MSLHHLAMTGKPSALRGAMAEGISIESRDEHGQTPLMAAASANRAESIRILMQAGAHPHGYSDPRDLGRGETPVASPGEVAVRHGLLELIAPIVGGQARVKEKRTTADGPSALMIASALDHAEAVEALLAGGASADLRERDGFSALSYASALGHAGIVRRLLEAGAEVNQVDHYKMKPVVLAALFGSAEAVRVLCEAEANASPADPWKHTLKLLIDAGADVNGRDSQGRTALWHAITFGSIDHVRLLLEHGADPNGRAEADNFAGQTPLILICGHGPTVSAGLVFRVEPERRARLLARDEFTICLLIDHGADVNARDLHGRTALMHAAERGEPTFARLLLDAGADALAADIHNGRSALHWAAGGGSAEVVRLLLDAGADRLAEDFDGRTPHALAIREGERKTSGVGAPRRGPEWRPLAERESDPNVEPLLRRDADKSFPRRSHARAFREAVEAGDVPALRASLAEGTDPNTRLSEGRTGLAIASENGQAGLARILLDAGANPNLADGEGRTPLLLAIDSANLEIVQSLLRAGADPDGFGRMHGGDRTTPLIYAIAERGLAMTRDRENILIGFQEGSRFEDTHLEIARALIDAGASLDAEDDLGIRPLWYALDTGEVELADLLIAAGAGKDSISAAYLKARSMPERAAGAAFQAVVHEVASLCGSEPSPLTGRPSRLERLRARDRLPIAPTLGVLFSVTRESAEALIDAHQDEFRERGAFLVLNSLYTGEFDYSRSQLGLLAASDWETVLAAVCSPGTDWGWVCPAFYIRDLRSLAADHPFRLIACESRSLQLEFSPPLSKPDDLAARLVAIRTHLGAPGLSEYPEAEDVAESLRQNRRISFYWD